MFVWTTQHIENKYIGPHYLMLHKDQQVNFSKGLIYINSTLGLVYYIMVQNIDKHALCDLSQLI